jgi:hypothetical protein
MANGGTLKAAARCRVNVATRVGRRQVSWSLSYVPVIPGAPYNLFSYTAAVAKGVDIEGWSSRGKIMLRKAGEVVGVATAENGQAVLKTMWQVPEERIGCQAKRAVSSKKVPAMFSSRDKAELWNIRLGHLSYDTMLKMVRDGAVTGMDVTEAEVCTKMKGTCDVCMEATHVAGSHPESDSKARAPLQRVLSDLMGQARPVSQVRQSSCISLNAQFCASSVRMFLSGIFQSSIPV